LFGVELTQDEAICFKDLKFIADHFDNLSLSPEGDDSGIVVRSMARSGSPSLHAILEESPSEDDSASSEGESSGFHVPRVCNVVTCAIPIVTTPPLEETLVFQTIPTVPQGTAIPRLDTGTHPKKLMTHQEEQQHTM
jgi:hypothetical protein